jgi:hypothetical protein
LGYVADDCTDVRKGVVSPLAPKVHRYFVEALDIGKPLAKPGPVVAVG